MLSQSKNGRLNACVYKNKKYKGAQALQNPTPMPPPPQKKLMYLISGPLCISVLSFWRVSSHGRIAA